MTDLLLILSTGLLIAVFSMAPEIDLRLRGLLDRDQRSRISPARKQAVGPNHG